MAQNPLKSAIMRALSFAVPIALAACGPNALAPDPIGKASVFCGVAREEQTVWRPGCATRGNIAALAENPDDLFLARQESPRDAMRRDAVISAYAQSRSAPSAPTAGAESSTGGAGLQR